MKVMTILGTRPEIIRLSLIISKLDRLAEHTLLHTGQNYEPELNAIFFDTMKIRPPDGCIDSRSETTFGQVAKILAGVERWIERIRPAACLILGDTNSGLSAIVAEKMGVPVFHMEAGNRCFDLRVPEEHNRKIIDHVSSWLLPYVENSRANLLNEGVKKEAIFVTGNPIYEVLQYYRAQIDASTVMGQLKIDKNKFFLVTVHRAENVDVPERLKAVILALNCLAELYHYPIIWSLHPRTRSKVEDIESKFDPLVRLCRPFDLFDFIHLEQNAYCVLTDSGTVQEECCIFHVPAVTLRDTTERPETLECGSNILSGCVVNRIIEATELVTRASFGWSLPKEYEDPHVSDKVVRLILGHGERNLSLRS